jgi:hypothetical protein
MVTLESREQCAWVECLFERACSAVFRMCGGANDSVCL